MRRESLKLLTTFLYLSALAYGSDQPVSASHGTINVILANKQGIVAVTDTRITFSNRSFLDGAPKLFVVDDHTICTIAGWYSDPGQVINEQGPDADKRAPAAAAIPGIFREGLINRRAEMSKLTLDEKLTYIARIVAGFMQSTNHLHTAAGEPLNPSISEITLAGFEDGRAKIEQVDLIPDINGNVSSPKLHKVVEVHDTLTIVLRGVTSIAEEASTHPSSQRPMTPVLEAYAKSKKTGQGRSLSLESMAAFGGELERLTAEKCKGVGGPIQIAKMTEAGPLRLEFIKDGRASKPTPIPSLEAVANRITENMNGNELTGDPNRPNPMIGMAIMDPWSMQALDSSRSRRTVFIPIVLESGELPLVTGGKFRYLEQPLDDFAFSNVTFDHCILTYAGSDNSMFGKSNKIIASELHLANGVDSTSPFVKGLRADFPTLKIVDSSGKVIP